MVLLSCSLGRWSFSVLLLSFLWTATHFSARYNFLINFAFSLHACGGVKIGTLHNCFCSLPLFSFTPSDFTEGSRQIRGIITKGRRLKLNPNLTGLLVQELVPIPEVIPFLRNIPRIPSWVFLDPNVISSIHRLIQFYNWLQLGFHLSPPRELRVSGFYLEKVELIIREITRM